MTEFQAAVTHSCSLLPVMADPQYRGIMITQVTADHRLDPACIFRIQVCSRLIKQQYTRFVGQQP